MTTLTTTGLSVHYGGVLALDGVDIRVESGETVGLIGPNGAGKTTFIDAVTGFAESTGSVKVGDRELTGIPPHRRARMGITRTFQQVELFNDLTVAENLSVVQTTRGKDRPPVNESLALLHLDDYGDRRPDELSSGRQRLVGVARAVANRPTILLLDEPAAGLDSKESLELVAPLRKVAASGVGILLIDHDVDFVLELCTRIYVLNFGRLIAQGAPREIMKSPAVAEAYLGDTGVPAGAVADQ